MVEVGGAVERWRPDLDGLAALMQDPDALWYTFDFELLSSGQIQFASQCLGELARLLGTDR